MTFNFRLGLRHTYQAVFKSKNTHFELKPRRILILIIFYVFFPFIELITWFAFLLDRIFYPKFEDLKIKNPVFVIGNYRSGTTLLHRLLSFDYKRFTSMTGWEIFIAPSIIQRKVMMLFVAVDRVFGSPIVRTFDYLWEKFAQGPVYFHKMGVREPEEDENLLAHIWSGIIPINMFPDFEDGSLPGYAFIDRLLNDREKKRIMRYYKSCIQRHLYYHGANHIYLSKSPSFSGNVETLVEAFPDAKFIYLVRSPFEVVPSAINMWAFKWHTTCEPNEDYPYKEELLDMIEHWYVHPYEALAQLPNDQIIFVNYENLVSEPRKCIDEIYNNFDFVINWGFHRRLNRFIRSQKSYRKPKKYSLKKMGLSGRKIHKRYRKVFKQYKISPISANEVKVKQPRKQKYFVFRPLMHIRKRKTAHQQG